MGETGRPRKDATAVVQKKWKNMLKDALPKNVYSKFITKKVGTMPSVSDQEIGDTNCDVFTQWTVLTKFTLVKAPPAWTKRDWDHSAWNKAAVDPNSFMLRSHFFGKRKDRGLHAIPGSSGVLRWQLPERSKKVKMKVSQSCLTLCNPMDYTVHWILQTRIPEKVAFPFSRRSSQSRGWTQVSCITGGFFTNWAIREAQEAGH